jgi:hypothetical protein
MGRALRKAESLASRVVLARPVIDLGNWFHGHLRWLEKGPARAPALARIRRALLHNGHPGTIMGRQ